MEAPLSSGRYRWRVADIALVSVIAVASAFIYWGFSLISNVPWSFLQSILPGLAGLINGGWLFAAPLAAIIVRKPGAALYAEVVAAALEALMGNQWGGVHTIAIGFAQGLGAELVFLFVAYKAWNLLTTTLSGLLAGVGCWSYSFFTHLQGISFTGKYGITYLLTSCLSGAIIAGIFMWYLYKAIALTGALNYFASGRAVTSRA